MDGGGVADAVDKTAPLKGDYILCSCVSLSGGTLKKVCYCCVLFFYLFVLWGFG